MVIRITDAQSCYDFAKLHVISGAKTRNEAADALHCATGMNKQSAYNLVGLLEHLLDEDASERRVNASREQVALFLDNIRADFGVLAYSRAIFMLLKSEVKHGGTNPTSRDAGAEARTRLR